MDKRCCIPCIVEDYVPMYYDNPPGAFTKSPQPFAPAANAPGDGASVDNAPSIAPLDAESGGDPVDDAEEEIGEDCESNASNEELLRKEALSLDHLSTHFPKNPFCQYCQRCKAARVRKTRKRFGKDKKPLKKFGDKVTADTLIAKKAIEGPDTVETVMRYAVVFFDGFSDTLFGRPSGNKGGQDAVEAIRIFAGSDQILEFYTDNA